MPKITYHKSSLAKLSRYALKKEIMQSITSTPEMRAEIRRVFQAANRRLQNVENAGVFSPAYEALGRKEGYTKFSMRQEWDTLRKDYAKAVSFLQQPTSTVTGAREYATTIRQRYGLSQAEFDGLAAQFLGKVNSVSDSDFVKKYLMVYKNYTGDFEQAVSDVSTQLEQDSVNVENALQRGIEEQAQQVADEWKDAEDTFIKGFSMGMEI